MPVYEVVGSLSVPFVAYVEAASPEDAEEALMGRSSDWLIQNRTDCGTVESVNVVGESSQEADFRVGH